MDNPTCVSRSAGLLVEPSSPSAQTVSSPVRQSSSRRTTRSSPLSESHRSIPQVVSNESFTCPICCLEAPDQVLSLRCGHKYCAECWTTYISSKIREEGEVTFTCMSTGCTLVIPDAFIAKVSSQQIVERFHELIVRNFVAHQSQLKFCPAPSCVYTVKCTSSITRSALNKIVPIVRCADGHAFCFGCSVESDHRPLICSVAKLWLKKCQDDSETANWIKSNTKECSKCQSTIEKNGGCKYANVLFLRVHLINFL